MAADGSIRSEILRLVPNGHSLVTDPSSLVLKGAVGIIAAIFVLGLAMQIYYLARHGNHAR